MKKIILLLVIAFIATGGYLWYNNFKQSPEYSLMKIRTAYNEHDVATFKKYVDVEAISEGIIEGQMTMDPDKPFANLANGFMNMIQSGVGKAMSKQILKVVELRDEDMDSQGIFLQAIKKNMNLVFKKHENIKVSITDTDIDGKLALVHLEFHLKEHDVKLMKTVKMRGVEDYWQMIDVSDILDVRKELRRLESAQ